MCIKFGETALRFNFRVSCFSKLLGGHAPRPPRRLVLHTVGYASHTKTVQLNILQSYNFIYGQSNLLLIGHSVQAIIYPYNVLCLTVVTLLPCMIIMPHAKAITNRDTQTCCPLCGHKNATN